jgi:hypothetical protein
MPGVFLTVRDDAALAADRRGDATVSLIHRARWSTAPGLARIDPGRTSEPSGTFPSPTSPTDTTLRQCVARRGRAAGVEPWHTGDEVQLVPRDPVPSGGPDSPYHRVVRPGDSAGQFVERLGGGKKVTGVRTPIRPIRVRSPSTPRGLAPVGLDPATIPAQDPIRSLDAALRSRNDSGADPGCGRHPHRQAGGLCGRIRGPRARAPGQFGEMALGIALYPVTVDQLMAVSDAGASCRQSPWFEPKLRARAVCAHAVLAYGRNGRSWKLTFRASSE